MAYHLPHGLFSPFLVDRYLNKAQSIPPPPREYYLFLLYDSEHSDFPVLWKTRHGLKKPPLPVTAEPPHCQLRRPDRGTLLRRDQADRVRVRREGMWGPRWSLSLRSCPRISSVSLYLSISLMESHCNSPATFVRNMHAMQSRQHLSVSSVNFLLQCLFSIHIKRKPVSQRKDHIW